MSRIRRYRSSGCELRLTSRIRRWSKSGRRRGTGAAMERRSKLSISASRGSISVTRISSLFQHAMEKLARAMNQLERIAVGLRAVMGQSDKIGGQRVNDVVNHRIAGRRFPKVLDHPPHLAVQGGDGQWGF